MHFNSDLELTLKVIVANCDKQTGFRLLLCHDKKNMDRPTLLQYYN